MSHEICADPDEIRSLADAVLNSSKTLSIHGDEFAEATAAFDRLPNKFGNLTWNAHLSSATLAAADDVVAATTALAAATTRDVEALLQTAANYQELEKGLGDNLARFVHRIKTWDWD